MLTRVSSLVRLSLAGVGAFILIVTFTPLVPWAALRLSSNWSDSDGNVLIVLGADTIAFQGSPPGRIAGASTYWRALYAIHAWRTGHFRHLLLCGTGIAQSLQPLLVAYGIPEQAILVEDRSTSTHENALFARPILAGLSGRFVLLTSDYHMFRAARCFAHERIPVVTRPIPDIIKRSNSRAFRLQGFLVVFTEFGKIAYYRIRGWI